MNEVRRALFTASSGMVLTGLVQGCGGGASASPLTPNATASPANAPPPYPQALDASAASAELVDFFTGFFTAKSLHDAEKTMSYFSPDLVSYMDATLGLDNSSFAALNAVFSKSMPRWPKEGLSYPTRILGDMSGALVAFTDTPELFGGEIRALGTVDFKDGKIVRWLDHWDARGWPNSLGYPKKMLSDFREASVPERSSPVFSRVAGALNQALTRGDSVAAAALFSSDAIHEDMALRLQIQGRDSIKRYFARSLATLPNGIGSSHRHAVGSSQAGGYEWKGQPGTQVQRGVTALTLDRFGLISRSTSVYDSTLLSNTQFAELARLSFD